MELRAPATLICRTPMFCVGRCRNVVLLAWLSSPTDDGESALPYIEQAYAQAYAERQAPFGIFVVVSKGLEDGLPGGGFRVRFARARRAWGAKIACEAVVFTKEDWRVSLLRTLVTHLDRLAGSGIRSRVFGEYLPALSWLASHLPADDQDRVTAVDILNAARALEFPDL